MRKIRIGRILRLWRTCQWQQKWCCGIDGKSIRAESVVNTRHHHTGCHWETVTQKSCFSFFSFFANRRKYRINMEEANKQFLMIHYSHQVINEGREKEKGRVCRSHDVNLYALIATTRIFLFIVHLTLIWNAKQFQREISSIDNFVFFFSSQSDRFASYALLLPPSSSQRYTYIIILMHP